MSKKRVMKPCKCGKYKKLNQFGLTDENLVRHTWVRCEFMYVMGA